MPETQPDPRPVVVCPQCKLTQFYRPTCRRCPSQLPFPTPPPKPPPPPPFGVILPTIAEMEASLIREAYRRTGSLSMTATLLKVGKTTIYRKAHLLGIPIDSPL